MDQPIRRLYLIRHGEVAYFDHEGNALDPWTAPLTEHGTLQIGALATALLAAGVDRIVTSEVPRALATADILGRRFGLTPIPDAAWNELEPGNLALVSEADLPGVILDAYRDAPSPGARFFGGELFTDLAERVDGGLARVLADPAWTTLAVVTHDPVARYLLAKTLDRGLAGMRFFEQDAGCLNVIDWIPGPDGSTEPIVRLVNGTPDNLAKAGSREPALARFHRNYLRSRERP